MMREVVEHRDAVGDADRLEPALDALERAQALGERRRRQPDVRCRRAIAASALRTLCTPSSGDSNRPNGSPSRRTSNCVRPSRCSMSARPPGRVVRRGRTSRPGSPPVGASACACGLSAPSSSRPFRGTRFDQPAERQQHRVEVGVDVGVIELDVVDDGDVGQVLEELRRLVEERAVVLVALDDEVAAAARRGSSSRRRRS